MATYVNDLRLTELATGEGSGTWGTTTNQSLELIGEALGYATQEVFDSDADATTTIADGASDPARAMYFKITSAGSLTATRTCTIAPNTVSRVMFIENATSGSQSIAISQGSGASVTILTGKTAVVYLDGAGSGAAVVDAMSGVDPGVTDTLTEVLVAGNTSGGTNIELSTTDKVQFRDTGIYINSSVDGQLDIVADTEIQIAATTIDVNGTLAFDSLKGTGATTVTNILDEDNMASDSATAIATQQSIKAYVDSQVGTVDTLSEILANGNTTGANDIDVDSAQKVQFRDADIYLNSSVDGQLDIVADTEIQIAATTVDLNGDLDVSGTALVAGVLTTTAATVFNGGFASNADSTLGTDKKVQFRDAAIYLNSSVDGQLDIVADTEIQIAATTVDLNGNLDVSGTALVTGVLTTTAATVFNGGFASNADSTLGTDKKVQFRDSAIYINSSADGQLDLVADTEIQIAATTIDLRLGVNAGNSIEAGGNYNVVVGDEAGTAITTGSANTALGHGALKTEETASHNTAIGFSSLGLNDGGQYNVAVGNYTLDAQTTANYNTAVGYSAGTAVTTGIQNTLIGGLAGDAITTASNNTAVGYNALSANTTGANNSALGTLSLDANTEGQGNTASGYGSLGSNTTASFNGAFGFNTLVNNTTGSDNNAFGTNALSTNTTGANNTAMGRDALNLNTTASNNTAVGYNSLKANTTGANKRSGWCFML
jgi:hypothetical protein